ncbi:MAG TPA: RHS repeat-associated core domain-containing protein [Verrucomicrobiales bacterium]|nr:RHS repeat-associated core domain-containing protein [Verrucomicrobiales bacterium]
MPVHLTVNVNSVNAARQDDNYHRELAHTGRPGFLGVTVQSYNAQGQPVGSPETGAVYVPRATETLSYDFDGNLLGDGRWVYGWDAEDRLVSMETQPQAVSGIPAAQSVKLLFDYDGMGRRIRKRVYQPASSGTPVRTERYVWDGWLCAAKLDGVQTEAYVWRVDLAGSLEATRGWLAAVMDLNSESGTVSGVHFPAYDGNGNVMALVSEMSGYAYLTARYEYDPFGNELRRTGGHAENNPWRFSTKWTDRESGLSYYGYRYYDPVRGRWLSRDPLSEPGHEFLSKLFDTTGVAPEDKISPPNLYNFAFSCPTTHLRD